MNLKYKILWFEDDEEVISKDVGPLITDFLTDLGFSLEIIHKLSGEQLNELIKDRNIDLIVTDLNLGEHETGEVLIDNIRNGEVLTEVLLYSASAADIKAIIDKKEWVERASFCVGIANLREKLKGIISLTIKKNQDVNNVRGLVIAATIDLERKIENILLGYFLADAAHILDTSKYNLLQNIHAKKIEKHQEDIKRIKDVAFTEIQLLIDNDILTTSNSFDAIHSILKEKRSEVNRTLTAGKLEPEMKLILENRKSEIDSLKKELANFREEVLKIRNTLAHVKEEFDDDGIPFLNSINKEGKPIKFDNAKYIEIRKNLHKHSVNLDKILHHTLN